MKRTHYLRLTATFAVIVFGLLSLQAIHAQTSAFTYQGKLNAGGSPANASFDMQFRLFDSQSGGDQIETTQTIQDVQTLNGIFTVQLDFGSDAFAGAERWIEISISPAGEGNFVTLAPRQQINAAPYSVKALNAAAATNAVNLGGIPADQYTLTGDPRLSDARAPLPGSNDYVQNTGTSQPGVSFAIGGTGSANILNAGTQFNLGGQRFLSASANGNLFVGNGTGTNITTGEQNTFVGLRAGEANTFGSSNSFFGADAGRGNTGQLNSFFGASTGLNNLGTQNSFFGGFVGYANVNGSFNSFFGYGAGFSNTEGSENSFFGGSAGISNTTGNRNSFIGFEAGRQSLAGNDNSFFGARAGGNNFSGSTNSFIGSFAGRLTNTGSANSFVGASAGYNNAAGNSNLFVGASAGIANSSGSRNTIIGTNANLGTSDLMNAAAIGYGALVTQSNSLVLGGITGFNSGTDVNVGIGTTAPLAKLHVARIEEGIRLQGKAPNNNNLAYMSFYDSNGTRMGYVGDGGLNDRGLYLTSDLEDVALVSGFGRVLTASFTGSVLMRGGPNVQGPTVDTYAAQTIETGSFKGLFTPNLFLSSLDTFLPSAVHVCARIQSIGGTGGHALTRCTASISSEASKTDVQQFSGGLDIVRRLNPLSFRWKADGGNAIGFNTEEVAQVAPQIVGLNADGKLDEVKESSLNVIMVSAIKEQQKQIEAQAEQIRKQKEQIDALRALVCQLNPQAAGCSQ